MCRFVIVALTLTGCLPNGPPTGSTEGTAAPMPSAAKKKTPSAKASPTSSVAANDPPIGAVFTDDFDRATLGADWRVLGTGWRIEDGKLCGEHARNRGVWLTKRLPTNARIEIDAVSNSPDGDLKIEAWGDGASGATGSSYTNATSYLAILGGWKNTLHVLARLDEHGGDRQTIKIDPNDDDPRARPVSPGQVYRFKIERNDGHTISFFVDDLLLFRLDDPAPLDGLGHDHFGVNDWEVPVRFDNLRVTSL